MKCFLNERLCCLSGGVDLTEGAESRVARHEVVGSDHEVRVGLEVGDGVELGEVLAEERGLVFGGAKRSELSQPDGSAAADLVGLLNVGDESLTVLSLRVPVNGAEVDLAASLSIASLEESLEPLKTLTGVAAVGDGRSTDEDLARVGVKPLSVAGSGTAGSHGSLTSMVGLVEAENGLGSLADGLVGVAVPAVSVEGLVVPEHGHKAILGVETVGRGIPVVSPAALGAAAAVLVGKLGRVVGQTSLGETERARGGASVGLERLNLDVAGGGSISGLDGSGQSGGSDLDDDGIGLLLGLGVGDGGLGGSGNLLASVDNDGLVDGDPFNVAITLLDVVLVAVSVGVESHGLLGKSGGGSEEGSLVNHFAKLSNCFV